MRVTLQNVRSFSRKHVFSISPLTILVGENSSGKTTFLAMLSALLASKGFPGRPNFNEPPYDLGSYDTIATYRGRRYGRSPEFSIGYADDKGGIEVMATYGRRLGEATLQEFSITEGENRVRFGIENQALSGRVTLRLSPEQEPIQVTFERDLKELGPAGLLDRSSLVNLFFGSLHEKPEFMQSRNAMQVIFRLIQHATPLSAQSVAPVRTKPKRTYDEIRGDFDPEGDHIPLVLDRALGGMSREDESAKLKAALERFGHQSGLFEGIKVKKLGKSASDPFQILVAVDRLPFNLSDVGYGVSQSLPIVVQSILGASQRLLLLQQPEVHLHPKAQAALGSFFVELIAAQSREFVIETHSDFLVDRVRQEVARGVIPPESVTIIFFSRHKGESRTYSLTLDRAGNILGAPPRYREFFLKEETALLSRTSS